jgi:hypothetical protein
MASKNQKGGAKAGTRKPKAEKVVTVGDAHDEAQLAEASADLDRKADEAAAPDAAPAPADDTASPTTPAAKVTKQPKSLGVALTEISDLAERRGYATVIGVTEQTKDGSAKRVLIECGDPQTKQEGGQDVSVCEKTREIAVQDLFQVRCCAACADRLVRKARRNRAKARNKQARALLKAREDAKR